MSDDEIDTDFDGVDIEGAVEGFDVDADAEVVEHEQEQEQAEAEEEGPDVFDLLEESSIIDDKIDPETCDELDLNRVEAPDPLNQRVVTELSKTTKGVRRAALRRGEDDEETCMVADDVEVPLADETAWVVSCADAVETPLYDPTRDDEEQLISLYGRVVVSTVDHDDDEDAWGGSTANVRLVDGSGMIDVLVNTQMPMPAFIAGDELIITDVKQGPDGLIVTRSSKIGVVERGRHSIGMYLEQESELVHAENWYKSDQYDGREMCKRAIVKEYHLETPRGQGRDETIYMYVDDADNPHHGVFIEEGEEILRERLEDYLPVEKRVDYEKNAIISGVKDRTRVEPDAFQSGRPESEKLQWSIAVENGVIDLRTGELTAHSPEYRFINKAPIRYEPDAPARLEDGIAGFLDSITNEVADRELLLQMVGHALPRTYPVKAIFSLIGPGDNGKSIWLRVIKQLLGKDLCGSCSVAALAGDSDSGFSASNVIDRHCVIDDDATGTKIPSINLIKKLSGGNEAEVEQKFKDRFSYENYATMIISSNNPFIIGDKTESVKGRVYPVLLPYIFTPDPSDDHKDKIPEKELMNRLTADGELEALLRVAVEYAGEMYRTGDLQSGRSKEDRWELYTHYSDTVLRFWNSCMQQERGARVTKKAVYQTYVQWCNSEGVEPVSNRGRNSFWSLSNESHAVSFDDGKYIGQDTAVEHVTFDSDAMHYAPAWVRDEWSDEIDEDTTTLGSRLDRVTPIADLSAGYATTRGTVISRDIVDRRDGLAVKLIIEDDTHAIDVIERIQDQDEDAKLDGVHTGEEVKLTRVVLSQEYGVPELKVTRVTDVETDSGGFINDSDGDDSDDADTSDETRDSDADTSGDVDADAGDVVRVDDALQRDEGDVVDLSVDVKTAYEPNGARSPAQKVFVTDEGGVVGKLVCWVDAGLTDGDSVLLRDVQVDEYEMSKQLVFSESSSVEHVKAGTGFTCGLDSGDTNNTRNTSISESIEREGGEC